MSSWSGTRRMGQRTRTREAVDKMHGKQMNDVFPSRWLSTGALNTF
uniref:Uncharacterized protein n=1 Tax=Noctiluca scintillans TaxID=2966 RepID=A7WQ67_NOCSC|nr:unknown [Noctiluca scintillans]